MHSPQVRMTHHLNEIVTMSPPRRTAGLTLVELLLALLVFVIAGLGVLGAYQAAFELMEVGQQTLIAVNDLRDMTEQIKDTAFTAIPANFPGGVANCSTTSPAYSNIVGGCSLNQEQITVTYPNGAGTNPLEIVIQISWTNRNRTYSRSLSTIRASAT